MELAEDLPQQLVQEVLGILATQVALDDQGENNEQDTDSKAVDNKNNKTRFPDKFTGNAVKAYGSPNHDSKGHQGAKHVEKRLPHTVGSVLLGPHNNHGKDLENGSRSTDNGNALDAKPHFRRAENNVSGNGSGKDARIEERGDPHAFAGVETAYQNGLQAKPKTYG